MSDTLSIPQIEELVEKLIADSPEIFLVTVRIKPTNNIKIFLDADSGLNIDKSAKINRALYRTIEENGWYPDGNFSLEVSSPGVDEPLKLLRQYQKNVGRTIEVQLAEGNKQEGKLLAASEEAIQLQVTTGKNKKAVTTIVDIPFTEIKQVKVLISF
ncbi:MAG: hypothetical protein RL172_561 [Bacteroidota bacterium]|jgi:ribosome maturation factor RimP